MEARVGGRTATMSALTHAMMRHSSQHHFSHFRITILKNPPGPIFIFEIKSTTSSNLYERPIMSKAIVICGPSGSGKSTLLKRLLADNKDKLAFTISHTTRAPRKGELDGREYYFISRDEMRKMINNNEFVEHTEFSGNLYGTSKKAVQDALRTDKLFILEVDIEGVRSISKHADLKPVFIFIKPPSKQLLIERLSSRGTESQDALKKRLDRADDEIKFADSGEVQFDLVLVNDDLEETYQKLKIFLSL